MRVFDDPDFDCLAPEVAAVAEGPVIAARQRVVRKLRDAHRALLGARMAQHGLHPHWLKEHLTNMIIPKDVANGGYVDFLRMGYGKPRNLVELMARRGGFNTELTYFGTSDMMSFFMTGQVQVGLTWDGWWVNFYVHDKGWLEQQNLVWKVKNRTYRDQCIRLLADLQNTGYRLVLYRGYGTPAPTQVLAQPGEYLDKLAEFHARQEMVSISVELPLSRNGPENNAATWQEFVATEMERLVPLYRFVSWCPETNHHIPKL